MQINNIFFLRNTVAFMILVSTTFLLSSCGDPNAGVGSLGGGGGRVEVVKQPVLSDSVEGRDDPIASQLAMKFAGFPKKTPDGYWYADTKKATSPTKSFGVFSKSSNQKILFLIFDDNTATQMLPNFVAKPPYTNVGKVIKSKVVSEDEKALASTEKFKWILSDYPRSSSREHGMFRALVGGMPSIQEGKSILVVARSFDDVQGYSHTNTLFIIDNLTKDRQKQEKTEVADESPKDEKKLSTDEEIDEFLKVAQESINENLSLPDKIVKASKKYKKKEKKERKWKGTQLLVGVNPEGKLRSLGDKTKVPTDENKMVVKALIEAVQSVGTFKKAPTVEASEFKFIVRLIGTKAVCVNEVEKADSK